jgi:hypothetical protein
MSTPTRVAQIQSSTPTIVKRIVLGTPIKTVAGSTVDIASLNGVSINTALNHDILVYDSSTGKFVNQHNTPGIVTSNHYVITDSNRGLDYLNVADLQAGDINFTGNIYKNGVAFGLDSTATPIFNNIVNTLVDSAYIQARQSATGTVDSAGVQSLVDSAYIQARQDFAYSSLTGVPNVLDSADVIALAGVAAPPGIDSAATVALIDSAYIQARQLLVDSAAVYNLIDSAWVNSFLVTYFKDSSNPYPDGSTPFSRKLTDFIDSGYVQSRQQFDYSAIVNTPNILDSQDILQLIDSNITTDNIIEGSNNLFYTTARSQLDTLDIIDSQYVVDRSFKLQNAADRLDSWPGIVVTGNLEVTGDIIPTIPNRFNIGSVASPFKTGFFSAKTLVLGDLSISSVDGQVSFAPVNELGETQVGVSAPVLLSDSNIARTTDMYWSIDSNRLRIDVAGFETLRTEIGPFGTLNVQELRGPSELIIDPLSYGTAGGTVIIRGSLVVEGETTTIHSNNLTISDKQIIIANDARNAAEADNAGIIFNGANASLKYKYTTNSMDFNKKVKAPEFEGVYLGFDSDFVHTTTNRLPEGNKNLYYTDERVYDFINVYVDETYIRDRQSYTGGADSALIASIVGGLLDSDNLSNLGNILGAATDISGVINSIVTATYINNRFAGAGGTATTVTTTASLVEYVYQPDSSITSISGIDINGLILSYDPSVVQVFLNGSKLVNGLDYTTNVAGSIIEFFDTVGSGNTIVISNAGSTAFNFINTVEKINVFFADTLVDQVADSFAKNTIRSVKYIIGSTVTVNSQPKHEVRELLLIHNNLNVFLTEYGQIGTVDSSLAEFDAIVDGSDIKLIVTPAYPNTTVKILRTPIEV